MPRWLTVLFAAAEALLVLAIGVAVPLAIGSIVWAVDLGFEPDWVDIWRAAADLWLLGHGTDVTFHLDAATAAALGAGADAPLKVTIALLGFAVLTAALAVRAGRRISEVGHPIIGIVTELVVFAGGSAAVVIGSLYADARASIWQGIAFPTLVFAIGLCIGVGQVLLRPERFTAVPSRYADAARRLVRRWPAGLRLGIAGTLRAAVAAVLGLVVVGSAMAALALVLGFTNVLTLYEKLHTEVLGGIALTLGQLALLPDLIVWAVSWVVGPGFAIGTGSAAGPFSTLLGPLPPVPALAAVPAASGGAAWLVLLLPLGVGFVVGFLSYPRIRSAIRDWWAVLVGIASGAVAGLVLGLLAWASSGAAGPGRLAEIGPDGVAVGVWGGLELAASITVGLLAAASIPAYRRPHS